MCFPNSKPTQKDVMNKYNEDGTVNDSYSENDKKNDIPDNLPTHIENPHLNCDLEDGIHAFVYENRDEVIMVFTSDEAYELHNQ